MGSRTNHLDRVIQLAEQELKCLKAEDVDGVEELCDKRAELMAQVLSDESPSDPVLEAQLIRLQKLQEEMTFEAQKLKDKIKNLILSSNKQGNRFKGYGKAVSYTPRIQNKYLNKRS
ncbi:MAG: hypothetical protein ACNI27_04580 [Desulfovibrio sp.]